MPVNLSDSEWKLMNLLWERAPRTIMELAAAVRPVWSKNTVITMLARMEAKGAVRYESGGKAREYYPAVERADAERAETESFLGKVYGGSLGLMMNATVENRVLSEKDIASSRPYWSGRRRAGNGGAVLFLQQQYPGFSGAAWRSPGRRAKRRLLPAVLLPHQRRR